MSLIDGFSSGPVLSTTEHKAVLCICSIGMKMENLPAITDFTISHFYY